MEFDLIARIRIRARARAGRREDVELGIGDDAAVLRVPDGMRLVVTTDTLNAGVHFPAATAAADIGWKALAVNLSDLAAMAARPAWCTLSLSLPRADTDWIDGFLDGFLALAAQHGVALVGGDTTRGSLSVCVTAHGLVEPGRALRRDGARVGDDVWVTGSLGDAAGALALPASAESTGDAADASAWLRLRLDRPQPRLAAGAALAGIAHACIDVSDGLLADLGHVCAASRVGAEVRIDALPASDALCERFAGDARRELQAAGGDDYELCFTAPPDARDAVARVGFEADVAVTRIGRIVAGDGVRARDGGGRTWRPRRAGYAHFADPEASLSHRDVVENAGAPSE
ncbi:thiamine-phosphate kinase [Luteimonas sp. R10]|uniref:thiamine-phosphate kinase n=1 Tax=Luteimonas sp. R10 TaxID=3108176 RepID=UPI003090CBB7|nr:thiamine-phosphate kinase [Luteimonas sp. R10]